MTIKSSRNTNIDALKAIGALSVVFLHYNHIEGVIWGYYTAIIFSLTTFAVPFFFMTTGYFIPSLLINGRENSYIKKILMMALCSSSLYFIYYCSTAGNSIDWIKTHYTLGSTLMWVTGQDDPAGFHLWYFYCLICSFILTCFVIKRFKYKYLYCIAILLVCYHVLGTRWFDCYTQSIPAMSAGIVIYQYREKIIELPRLYILFLTLLTAALYVNHFVNEFVMGAFYEGHLLALILFIFAIRHPDVKFYGSDWLAKIGLKYSAYIYIYISCISQCCNFKSDRV